ncbi:MAG: hypothetical protein ACK6DP_20115 [Gemmatimonas sp.]|jgi:hypothetical protein|uniref:hypothetical protein n=1 Tax=Gemmatimonas sp. TaxID=1962908 RepID=UPI00391F4D17|nr:hypothetical protein [Gemmatimonadota bacterium]
MASRLQVLVPVDEIAAIRAAAARRRVTVTAWVRQTLGEAIAADLEPPRRVVEPAVRAVRESARQGYRAAPLTTSDHQQIEELLTRLDGDDDDAEAAWDAEIARWLKELRASRARLMPAEEVFGRIRQ